MWLGTLFPREGVVWLLRGQGDWPDTIFHPLAWKRFDYSSSQGSVVEGVSRDERFVQVLTASQGRLLAYISCLLGNVHDANTVLQETNLTLWRKIDIYPEIRSFDAWSREIAYYQALAFLRDRKRDKLIFSQEAIDSVWETRKDVDFDERRLALRDCVSQLRGERREVIQKFYMENKRVRQIAVELGKSEGAIKMSLKRVRLMLMNCVNKRMELAG